MDTDAFLRACLRVRDQPSALGAVRAHAAALGDDWASLQAIITNERIGPLLYRTVGPLGILPAALIDALHQHYRLTALRNISSAKPSRA